METIITTRTNVQIIEEGITQFLKGNVNQVIEDCADDIVWHSYKVPGIPFTETFRGKEGVQEYFMQLAKNVRFTAFETREFISQGDRVIVLGHTIADVISTGKSIDNEWCMSIRMQAGKLKEYFIFLDSYQTYKAYQV
jgi:ketosteroid isomerase-like protein